MPNKFVGDADEGAATVAWLKAQAAAMPDPPTPQELAAVMLDCTIAGDADGLAALRAMAPHGRSVGRAAESEARLSRRQYAMLSEAGKVGLVKKTITNKVGNKQTVYVSANADAPAATGGSAKDAAFDAPGRVSRSIATPAEWAGMGSRPKSVGDITRPAPRLPADPAADATADKWLEGATHLTPESRRQYHADLGAVLTNLPAGSRAAAEANAGGPGCQVFYADSRELGEAADRFSGQKPKGRTVGFVRHLGANGAAVHLDGGDSANPKNPYDSASVYAHELGHAIDANQQFSSKKQWKAAYKSDILKGKTTLSQYALTDESEGFAELYRVLYTKGPDAVKLAFPKCHKFLEDEKLL